MPLFVCERCGAIENTACGGTFWHSKSCVGDKFYKEDKVGFFCKEALCCKCHTGRWHNKFPYEIATEESVMDIGLDNFMKHGLKKLNIVGDCP